MVRSFASLTALLAVAVATPSPIAWLQPSSLPANAGPLNRWRNSARTGAVYDAVVDGSANLARAPRVALDTATGALSAEFTSSGRFGLGSNLIVPINLSGKPTSIFYWSKLTGTGDRGQRLLGARNSNWLLGYWQGDRYPNTPTQGVAYASPSNDGVFLATLYEPATHDWLLYELVVTGEGVGTAYQNGVAIGTGPAVGPNILRLGGGIDDSIAEFGTGLIAEVMVFNATLSDADRVAVENYFFVKYAWSV